MDTIDKIYLLSPNNSTENNVKIIWADSVEDARKFSDFTVMQRSTSEDPPLLEDGIYTHESTQCDEVTADITDLQYSNNTIKFKYNGLKVSLAKDHAESLSKFVK